MLLIDVKRTLWTSNTRLFDFFFNLGFNNVLNRILSFKVHDTRHNYMRTFKCGCLQTTEKTLIRWKLINVVLQLDYDVGRQRRKLRRQQRVRIFREKAKAWGGHFIIVYATSLQSDKWITQGYAVRLFAAQF